MNSSAADDTPPIDSAVQFLKFVQPLSKPCTFVNPAGKDKCHSVNEVQLVNIQLQPPSVQNSVRSGQSVVSEEQPSNIYWQPQPSCKLLVKVVKFDENANMFRMSVSCCGKSTVNDVNPVP